jgi:hypothetical protein
MRLKFVLFIYLTLTSCIGKHYTSYDKIPAYVGSIAKVCGTYLDRSNLKRAIINNRLILEGISVIGAAEEIRKKGESVCITGKIVYLGCGTNETLCVDAAYEYAVELKSNFDLDKS